MIYLPACGLLTERNTLPLLKKMTPPHILLPCLTSPHPHWVHPHLFLLDPRMDVVFDFTHIKGPGLIRSPPITATRDERTFYFEFIPNIDWFCLFRDGILFVLSWKPFGDGLNASSHWPAVICIELSFPCSLTSRLYMRFTPGRFFWLFSFIFIFAAQVPRAEVSLHSHAMCQNAFAVCIPFLFEDANNTAKFTMI